MGLAPEVCWRVSKRGLVIAGVEGDALLLEHPRAAQLPDLVADHPAAALLAERLGAPNGEQLVAEMTEAGVLAPTSTSTSDAVTTRSAASCPRRWWGIVLTRSGGEFPGIERPARWLARWFVPVVVSWPGRVLLAALVVSGVVALLAGRPNSPTVSANPALEALLGLGLMLVLAASHELAHAVALVHYGRRPRRAGFGFYWGGISFYVDSTEAMTLPRRSRVTQALVGLGVDVVTVSLLAITAHLSTPVIVVAVAWRLAVVGVVDIVTNLLPILEVDGHWALADYLDEPELAHRARAAFGDTLRRRRSRDIPRWLAAYGAASLLGGIALLLGGALVWWAVAADLVRALFAGSVTDIIIGVVLVGPLALSVLLSTLGLLLEVALPSENATADSPRTPVEPHVTTAPTAATTGQHVPSEDVRDRRGTS